MTNGQTLTVEHIRAAIAVTRSGPRPMEKVPLSAHDYDDLVEQYGKERVSQWFMKVRTIQ